MKIGVFDSGYGGLTILDRIRHQLPKYDYLYLGDNARAPYGSHSFEVIYQYTWQAAQYLLRNDCALVILACNTASAKALRTIQQHDLPALRQRSEVPNILGVIRPTVEEVLSLTHNGHIGIVGTQGTIDSLSYPIELQKLWATVSVHPFADLQISQQACPMWVPLIEAGEHLNAGADYFVDKYLTALFAQDPQIDTVILGCTHYPLLKPKIDSWLAAHHPIAQSVAQGDIVASSLDDYLVRHTSIRQALSLGGSCQYLTTESAQKFTDSASVFLSHPIQAQHITL
ncbi:MAG: glutamate racemase [Bacteroidales bacterium]|nr:glutamate racemase [Bacteroidales bacterium]